MPWVVIRAWAIRFCLASGAVAFGLAGAETIYVLSGEQRGMGAPFTIVTLLAGRIYGWRVGLTAACISAGTFHVFFGGPSLDFGEIALYVALIAIGIVSGPDFRWLPSAPRTDSVEQPIIPKTYDWSEAVEAGAASGLAIARQIKDKNVDSLLGWSVAAMVDRRQFGGWETGFCAAVSHELRMTAPIMSINDVNELLAKYKTNNGNLEVEVARFDGDDRSDAVRH